MEVYYENKYTGQGMSKYEMYLPEVLQKLFGMKIDRRHVFGNYQIKYNFVIKEATLKGTDLDHNPINFCEYCKEKHPFTMRGLIAHTKIVHPEHSHKFKDIIRKETYKKPETITNWRYKMFIQLRGFRFTGKYNRRMDNANIDLEIRLDQKNEKELFSFLGYSPWERWMYTDIHYVLEHTDFSYEGEHDMRENFEKHLEETVGSYLRLPKENHFNGYEGENFE